MSKNIPIPKKKRTPKVATVAVDFDGVLCDSITREPLPMALDALAMLTNKNIKVIIFSARATREEGKEMIINWLRYHTARTYEVTGEKPLADVYIDDRAIYHTDWQTTLEKLSERLGLYFL